MTEIIDEKFGFSLNCACCSTLYSLANCGPERQGSFRTFVRGLAAADEHWFRSSADMRIPQSKGPGYRSPAPLKEDLSDRRVLPSVRRARVSVTVEPST